MTKGTSEPLTRIGDLELNTPQLREALEKTGEPLGMAGVRAFEIDAAIAKIIDATALGVEDFQRYNEQYGGPLRGASLAVLGGSPLRRPTEFKLLVAQIIARNLTAAGIPICEPHSGKPWPTVRAAVDKIRGLSLLVLVQNWRSASPDATEPDKAV